VTDQQPVEPSEVYRADGGRLPQRRTATGLVPAGVRSLLPALLRRTGAGSLVTASAVAVAAAVTARAAGAARQVAQQAAREAAREAVVRRPPGSWVEVSVTRVEVRWPR
jgi:hypothetical protein